MEKQMGKQMEEVAKLTVLGPMVLGPTVFAPTVERHNNKKV